MKLRILWGGAALAVAIAGPAVAADNMKIGYITKFPAPYFQTMEDAAKAYAKDHPNLEIIYGQGTSPTDIEGQIALIEKMVAQGVQGIAITPVDPSVSTTLDKAVANGVKVVLMDNSIPDWKNQTALATTDNYAAGKLAGEFLKSKLEDGDKLGILEAVPGVPALGDRVKGMLEGLKGVNADIVGQGATSCDQEKGLNLAQDILTANPDVKAFYSACGAPAVGAVQAIKNAKLDHHVIVVGFDFCCGEDGPDGTIATGEEDATVAQFPAKMSELGVDALVKALNGEKVESLIDSGAALVTKENLADFQ
jgi:ribose transport system substrate-binding protein